MNNKPLDTKDIGKRVKELRKSRDMDQLQASSIIGVSRSQWSNLENAKRNFNIQQIKNIADFFGVSLSTLGVVSEEIETIELLERAKTIFLNNDIPLEEKQKLAEQVMSMYLNVKQSNKDV